MIVQKLLDSRSKAVLLDFLVDVPGELSVSSLARFSELPKATVSRIVTDWEETGLVACHQQGRNKLVSVRKDFYFLPELKIIVKKNRDFQKPLLQKIRRAVTLKNKEVKAVVVFGSRMRKDFTSRSDMDVLVAVEDMESPFIEKIMDEFVKFSNETGVLFSPVFLSEKEIKERIKEGDHFIQNILLGGKILKGDDWLERLQAAKRPRKRKV